MSHQSKKISTADFNSLIETHRPNIIAYAMMLTVGELDRDAMVLLAVSAVWKKRKDYHPSEYPDFCEWCYQQIARKYKSISTDEAGGGSLVELIEKEAVDFLPATSVRMDAFDSAFIELSKREKNMLSLSCQHPRLQDKYIQGNKGLSREGFNTRVEELKSALLTKATWKGASVSAETVDLRVDQSIQHLSAGTLDAQTAADLRESLGRSKSRRQHYYRHVSLLQALTIRLEDEPAANLRNGEKSRKRVMVILLILGVVLIPLFASMADEGIRTNSGIKKVVYLVVPEPSTVCFLGVGLTSLILRRSRERV